jgi:ABC-type branched-subunit amino acid transport system permease subunit
MAADRLDPGKDQRAGLGAMKSTMNPTAQEAHAPFLPSAVALGLATIYVIALLAAERQALIIALLGLAVAVVLAAGWVGLLGPVRRSFAGHEDAFGAMAVLAAFVVAAFFHDNHFVLLLVVTVLLYAVATLGLNIQFGYAGVLNFAGASFLGVGAYTAAVLTAHTAVPYLLVLLIAGVAAALIGSLLLLPALRTRGHYAAVVTIAFALLFKTLLEVNDVLGGPQGLQVKGMQIFGWSFNDGMTIGTIDLSFYLNYFFISMALLVGTFVLVQRLERSWVGLNLDALRLDETAARCFGLNVARWKTVAFTLGNFIIGIAGALAGMVGGFVAPNNYTFADSLILVSVLLLGGIGSSWGSVAAALIVVVVPEKLQTIQEYRFLLYAVLVIAVLLLRPEGLLPRPMRRYFSGWQR